MDSAVPVGQSPSISDAADSLRRWIASLVLYVELRIRLLALESKEAAVHLLLAVLFVSALVLLVIKPLFPTTLPNLKRIVNG